MHRPDAVGRRWAGWVGLWALVLLLAPLGGCRQRPASAGAPVGAGGDAPAAGNQSEAEKTRQMEEKARQLNDQASDIKNMQGTEQEKIDAVNKLEQERQDLNKTGGDGGTPAAPPPQ